MLFQKTPMTTTLGHKPIFLSSKKITELSLLLGSAPTGTQGLVHSIQLLEVFTLLELLSLVKVFRRFKLEQMFFWC